LTMSIGEYKEEELKTAFNKITSIFLYYTNFWLLIIFPIYLSDCKKLSEWSLKFTSPLCCVKWGKNLICKKGIAAIFPLLCRYFSINIGCLFTYIFPHLPFLRSDTNHRKFTSIVE
jgi:hypothetical protein